ncbi:TadE/TadG family type IV pilus assembly protein [Asanoa siamensis]|uniref:Membrane protein n=1 Tax=Asanoa siamensis TaxID=926357 RepID=A0ABQ4CU12_9ACTN|nr:TadE family protein [Asanoa siamensis]GIF74764.1 membrane protein [Asanoa siamensis]
MTSAGSAARGSASVEVAILLPAFIMLMVVASFVGRVTIAQNAVDLAAHDGARAASIERESGLAAAAATDAANDTLDELDVLCVNRTITPAVDAAFANDELGPQDGPPPVVTVTVECVLDFVGFPFIGSTTTTVRASYTSPLDWYRGRSL